MKTLLAITVCLLMACVPTETGNPPVTPPETLPDTGIDDDFVLGTLGGPTNCEDAEMLDGGGCAAPTRHLLSGRVSIDNETAAVWVFNLRDQEPPGVAPVVDGGNFSLVLSYFGDSPTYRLQLRMSNPEVFYQPRDFFFQDLDGTASIPVAHPQRDCLRYIHTVRWNPDGTARLVIENMCSVDLQIRSVRSWSGNSQIIASPERLAAGQSATIAVSGDIEEDLLIVETGSTADEQIAIHVIP